MKKFKNKILPKFTPFVLAIILILIMGAILRAYTLMDNFIVWGDSARDIMITSQAILRHEIPLIGPFSSAGPFVTGPIYYWVLIISTIIFPFEFYGPWIMLLILSVLNILIFSYIGYLIKGKRLAILAGLLSATSYQMISMSLNLTNPSFIYISTSLFILFFILLIKKKRAIFVFLSGIFLGIALNMHYQALNLAILTPFIFLIKEIKIRIKFIWLIAFVLGILIPMVPLLWWDSHQNFSNINNILDYLLVRQYEIYVPNSWKIFIFKDMANIWGNIIGGSKVFGFMAMIIVGLGSLIGLIRFRQIKDKSEIYVIPLSLFIMLFINRFYNGQRSEVYLLYLTPFIILTIALSFELLLGIKNKIVHYVVYLMFFIFILGNLFILTSNFIKYSVNMKTFFESVESLKNKYPNTKFSVYDWNGKSSLISLPFSMILSSKNLESNEGMKIAVLCTPMKDCNYSQESIASVASFPIADISTFSAKQIKKEFQNVNEESVYDSLMGWSKRHELKHTFNLEIYLKDKLHIFN